MTSPADEDNFTTYPTLEWKFWSTMRDPLVCQRCKDNAAQGWIRYEETFQSGDFAPPAHYNPVTGKKTCRCYLRYQVSKTRPIADPPTLF